MDWLKSYIPAWIGAVAATGAMALTFILVRRPPTRIIFDGWKASRSRNTAGITVTGKVSLISTTNTSGIKKATCKVYTPNGVKEIWMSNKSIGAEEGEWDVDFTDRLISIPSETGRVKVCIDIYAHDGSHKAYKATLPLIYSN